MERNECRHGEHVYSHVGSSVGRCIWCGARKDGAPVECAHGYDEGCPDCDVANHLPTVLDAVDEEGPREDEDPRAWTWDNEYDNGSPDEGSWWDGAPDRRPCPRTISTRRTEIVEDEREGA